MAMHARRLSIATVGLVLSFFATFAPRAARAQDCVPACRAGFVCANGACVSACNPPCQASEICTAEGRCVASTPPAAPATETPPAAAQPATAAPTAAPPPATAPAAGAPGNSYAGMAGTSAVPAAPEAQEIGTVTFVPRVMLSAFGSGELACDGNLCVTNTATDYDHNTTFGVGADLLFRVGSVIRLGPGLGYLFEYEVEFEGDSDADTAGSDLDVSFVLDAAVPVSPNVWLVPRGQLGVKLLFPAGDLRDGLDEVKQDCEAAGIDGCDSLEGARPGVQFGIGFGAMFALGPNVRLRADAMYQYYKINLYTLEGNGEEASVDLTGGRGFLMAGVEF